MMNWIEVGTCDIVRFLFSVLAAKNLTEVNTVSWK